MPNGPTFATLATDSVLVSVRTEGRELRGKLLRLQ